jgi:hypothetical protein
MIDYRVYVLSTDEHIKDSANISCDSDEEAIEKARQLMKGHSLIEVWHRDRCVIRVKSTESR